MNRMKYLVLILIAGLASCSGNEKPIVQEEPKAFDSCTIALKFGNALHYEDMVKANYTGQLNNYRGDDTTKLDYTHFFEEGKLIRTLFYYEDGSIQEEYTFKCQSLHGIQKWFYPNGTLAKTIPYSYGHRSGTGLLYEKDGTVYQRVHFRNDSIIGGIETLDKEGNVVKTDTVPAGS
jgi:antitoxin component YwqK of YwqJK toxin-antitoxin module